jgi:hypothetical protein
MIVPLHRIKKVPSDIGSIQNTTKSIQSILVMFLMVLTWLLNLNMDKVHAQVIDEWRVYSSFSTVNDVVVTDQGYRFVATQGGLVITDPLGVTTTLTTMDGLHRLDIQKLAYHPASSNYF